MKITKEWIEENKACDDDVAKWIIETVGKGMEIKKLLPKFERADWLIWFLWKIGVPIKYLVEIAIICSRHALRFSGRYKKICERAIKVAEECLKNPTDENKQVAYEAIVAMSSAYATASTSAFEGYRASAEHVAAYAVASTVASAAEYVAYIASTEHTAHKVGYAASTVAYVGYAVASTIESSADYAAHMASKVSLSIADSAIRERITANKAICDEIREFLKKKGEEK